ncbi:hypothetical protein BsWGS_23512 [Bradybaena similaris]
MWSISHICFQEHELVPILSSVDMGTHINDTLPVWKSVLTQKPGVAGGPADKSGSGTLKSSHIPSQVKSQVKSPKSQVKSQVKSNAKSSPRLSPRLSHKSSPKSSVKSWALPCL